MEFQPTRPLRGATDGTRHTVHSRRDISTHAPLAGRDYRLDGVEIACDISTHAPLAGRDQQTLDYLQSLYISTHAPLAGRDREAS